MNWVELKLFFSLVPPFYYSWSKYFPHLEKYIPLLELAYNSHERASHGLSPFFIVHNFDAQLPIESLLISSTSPRDPRLRTQSISKWREEKVNECRRLRKFIKKVIELEQEDRRNIYGKNKKQFSFKVGELVWLFHDINYCEQEKE